MPNKRQLCQRCHFPQTCCLCPYIKPAHTRHQIIMLQHPSEVDHSKGSARLVKLAMPQATLVVGENAKDFAQLQTQLTAQQRPSYLVYPQPHSQPVESFNTDAQSSNLLFIDGSWRKTHKILQLNPWLQQLPSLSFNEAPKSRYKIRKAQRSDSLSTIESVAYCLKHLDDNDSSSLLPLFAAMIDNQWRFMSDEIKARYKGR